MALIPVELDRIIVSLTAGGGGSGRSRLLDVSFDNGTTQHARTTLEEVDVAPHLLRKRMHDQGYDLVQTVPQNRPERTNRALSHRVMEQGIVLV